MADRYFAQSPIRGDRALLSGAEAHHLLHVMRAQAGTRVVLFDGSGTEFAAEVIRIGRAEVELAILASREADRELPVDLILGVSLPKGDRQRWLAEKAVELGVRRLVPLRTARSVAEPTDHALARLQRTVIEASKQCGRNRLMEIAPPQNWAQYVSATREAACRLLAHPGGRTGMGRVSPPDGPGQPLLLAVGPEGGLADEEVAAAIDAGWQPVDLGPRTLRVETAAVLLVAMVLHRLLR